MLIMPRYVFIYCITLQTVRKVSLLIVIALGTSELLLLRSGNIRMLSLLICSYALGKLETLSLLTLKGTVSPDIVFYFKVYKLKSVLLVRPLIVFKLVYFVVL
jgi:hypothetical protein